MSEFVYTTVPGKIQSFFNKIREVGVPPKATVQWLRTIGFTSSNDASLLGILKQLGLVDGSSIPSPQWTRYRGANHKKVLGDLIRSGYSDLFAVYPDAWQRSQSEIEHVFSTSSTAGKQVIAKTVSTFKALCQIAEFSAVAEQSDIHMHSGPIHRPIANAPAVSDRGLTMNANPSVHIDVQIHIAPEASSTPFNTTAQSGNTCCTNSSSCPTTSTFLLRRSRTSRWKRRSNSSKAVSHFGRRRNSDQTPRSGELDTPNTASKTRPTTIITSLTFAKIRCVLGWRQLQMPIPMVPHLGHGRSTLPRHG